jgi:hypothetical protein
VFALRTGDENIQDWELPVPQQSDQMREEGHLSPWCDRIASVLDSVNDRSCHEFGRNNGASIDVACFWRFVRRLPGKLWRISIRRIYDGHVDVMRLLVRDARRRTAWAAARLDALYAE